VCQDTRKLCFSQQLLASFCPHSWLMAKLPQRHDHSPYAVYRQSGLGDGLRQQMEPLVNTTVVEFSQTRFQNPTLRGAADPSRHFAGA
jgi:hypothetical protein